MRVQLADSVYTEVVGPISSNATGGAVDSTEQKLPISAFSGLLDLRLGDVETWRIFFRNFCVLGKLSDSWFITPIFVGGTSSQPGNTEYITNLLTSYELQLFATK